MWTENGFNGSCVTLICDCHGESTTKGMIKRQYTWIANADTRSD